MTETPGPAHDPETRDSEAPNADAPGPDDRTPDPGPDLVEETRRIVGAVQEWMRRSNAPVAGEGEAGDATAPHATAPHAAAPHAVPPHAGSECEWCPICQLARAVRAERPELAEKLGVAATAVADALKALVEVAAAHTGDLRAPKPRTEPTAAADRPRPRPRVERIDLDGQD